MNIVKMLAGLFVLPLTFGMAGMALADDEPQIEYDIEGEADEMVEDALPGVETEIDDSAEFSTYSLTDGEESADEVEGDDSEAGEEEVEDIVISTSSTDPQLSSSSTNDFSNERFTLVFEGSESNWRYVVNEGAETTPKVSLHYYGDDGDQVVPESEYTLSIQKESVSGTKVSYSDTSMPLVHGSTGHMVYRFSAVAKSGGSYQGQTPYERGVIEVYSNKTLVPMNSEVSFNSKYQKNQTAYPFRYYEVASGTSMSPGVKVGSTTLSTSQYSVSYLNTETNKEQGAFPVDVGTYVFKATGKSPYYGVNDSVKIVVVPAQISGATVSNVVSKVYAAKALTQTPVVKLGDKTLVNGKDYKLSYSNNGLVGTATMTITGINNYKGTKKVTFKITKAANPMTVKGSTVKLSFKSMKKKAAKISGAVAIRKAPGVITYTNVSTTKALKKFSVASKTGKITVPKKTAKGTYSLKVKVSSTNSANYYSKTKTVVVKLKVS